jgi:cobalamin biosynthesis protein CobT
MVNGYYPPKQQPMPNQPKRPTKPTTDPNTLLTTAPIPHQQITSSESKTKPVNAPQNGEEEEEEEEDDDEDDEDESDEDSDDASSDRFSIKSDLAQINEESSKARRTPLLYIRPHLRAKFFFDQLIQVLPQSPSDTNQPATVEIISANVNLSCNSFTEK